MAEDQISLPQVDEELLAMDAGDFTEALDDVVSGRIDTVRADELRGQHEVEIVSAEIRGSKDKEGHARYPSLVIRLANPAWTTSFWWSVTLPPKAGAVANRLNTQKILKTFKAFAGEDFSTVEPPTAESFTLAAKVEYYQQLCSFLAGKKGIANFKVYTGKDGKEYPDHSLRPVLS